MIDTLVNTFLHSHRMDLVLELKNNASKLLLAIMESRTSDSENVAEKIIYNMNPEQLVSSGITSASLIG